MSVPAPLPRFLLLAATVLLLVGLGVAYFAPWAPRETPQAIELYYGDPQAMFLVPVDSEVVMPPTDQPSAWADALVAKLAKAPEAPLVAVVGSDLQLIEARYAAPEWTLRLQVRTGQGSALERLAIGALVRSLLASYPGAERVSVTLTGPDGKPYEGQHLDFSRALTAADFKNRLDSTSTSPVRTTVWWTLPQSDALVPVDVALSGAAGSPPRDALSRLVAGPPGEATAFLAPVVPQGLKPGFAAMQGPVVAVELAKPPSGEAGERFVEATVLTLTELPGVEAVRFTHQGKQLAASVGPYHLAEPVRRPARVNPVSPQAWASAR